jgi:hypothetical protein
MNLKDFRGLQAWIKERYRSEPDAALVTLKQRDELARE